jgi:hypothetical protein
MTKGEYQGKLSQLLKEMDELDVKYYDDDQFAFDGDCIMRLHDVADAALELAEKAKDVFNND